MERDVRILNQSPLLTRSYTDQTGATKTRTYVALELTDGCDTFCAEVTGDKATQLPQLDRNYFYRVRLRLSSFFKTKDDGSLSAGTNIWLDDIHVK